MSFSKHTVPAADKASLILQYKTVYRTLIHASHTTLQFIMIKNAVSYSSYWHCPCPLEHSHVFLLCWVIFPKSMLKWAKHKLAGSFNAVLLMWASFFPWGEVNWALKYLTEKKNALPNWAVYSASMSKQNLKKVMKLVCKSNLKQDVPALNRYVTFVNISPFVSVPAPRPREN